MLTRDVEPFTKLGNSHSPVCYSEFLIMIQLFCAIARVILIKYGGNIGRVYGANEGFSSCVAIGLWFLYFDDFDYHLKTT